MKDDLFEPTPFTVNLTVEKQEPKPFGLADMLALQLVRNAVDSNRDMDIEGTVRIGYQYARAMVKVREEV